MKQKPIQNTLIFLIFLALAASPAACESRTGQSSATAPETVRARFEGYSVQDLANYIAARPDKLPAAFKPITDTPAYRNLATQMDQGWSRYEARHLTAIRAWRTEVAGKYSQTVFYPFGGPDASHPTTIFPEATRYTLIGLEKFGQLPVPPFKTPAQGATQVEFIHRAVRGVLGRNFFMTISMTGEVGTRPDNGVVSILLFFLARLDYEIQDVYPVTLSAEGDLVPAENGAPARGMRVLFKTPDRVTREMNFIQANISDAGIPTTPGFATYLKKQRDVTTMLKAASFLLYLDTFDDVRNVILNGSRMILSDSSGMPFHFLNNNKWKLSHYGNYIAPIPLFRVRYEPDRRKYYLTHKAKPLTFAYGYHPTAPDLLLAERAADNAFAEPEFDGAEHQGITTFSSNGKLMVLGGKKAPPAGATAGKN